MTGEVCIARHGLSPQRAALFLRACLAGRGQEDATLPPPAPSLHSEAGELGVQSWPES
jgi:hypothetical protein